MRNLAHGVTHFPQQSIPKIKSLMKAQCSALRSAYQAIHKHDLKNNDIRNYVKKNYMQQLNQRYINDACSIAKGISHKGVLFGGKKNWHQLLNGNLSKEEWNLNRNSQLYSRGDRSHHGNPNIRIIGDKIFINDPAKRGQWIEGKVFIPGKFNPDWDCYDVRIILKKGKWQVKIGWEEKEVPKMVTVSGAIGIDINPDGVAVAEISNDGNFLNSFYIRKQRIQFASENKREYDINILAKEVVQFAVEKKKPLIIEKLSFKKGKKGWKKFNRMKHNFTYRKIIKAIKSRACKEGLPVIEVNPAFTSILGILKYQKMYSLNRHTSAAFVITRRGIGLKERQNFTDKKDLKKKGYLNLEGKGYSHALTEKAWSWLKDIFLKPKLATLTGSGLVADKPGIGSSSGGVPESESLPITGLVACPSSDDGLNLMKRRIS